jgi:proline iminopeptidase
MRPLYPELTPYASDFIVTSPSDNVVKHEVYFECCGNPNGIPIIYLHGGPGAACWPHHRRYIDPEKYHLILFDQRGCGRSQPLGELAHNTTQGLIDDMETIRQKLNITRWVLLGGSWGTTLGLCYAKQYPQHVLAMLLRGIFLGRQQDIEWVYSEHGAAQLFPAQWQTLMAQLNSEQRKSPLSAFMAQLQNDDVNQRLTMAYALYHWQSVIGRLELQEHVTTLDEAQLIAHYRIQLHYALNDCFISDKPLLSGLDSLATIPTWIVQGQYDLVCPTQQAWSLHQALPDSQLLMVHLAGHAANEDTIIDAMVRTTDAMALQFNSFITTAS